MLQEQTSLETKKQKEAERKQNTRKKLLQKVSTIDVELFKGWGARKRIAQLMGIPQGKLIYTFRKHLPEYLHLFD